MSEQRLQEVLVELGALRREVASYRAAHTSRRQRHRAAGLPSRVIATVILTLLVALVPIALLAAGPFTDLDPNSPHNDNINAIAAAGITKGCDPPTFTQYCPKDFVTREEMASFLARTAGLGGNPAVVHALTAETATTVVDGAIGSAKLSATGSTAGQVLTSTGAGVAWQNAPSGGGPQGPQGPQGVQGPPGAYARTIIVSPVGTEAQNGTALLNALTGITTASATNLFLLKIEPGIYDLGTTPLAMKQYVDIEGSGEDVTTITGTTSSSSPISTGTILGANNAELRFLTVANVGAVQGAYFAAIYINGTSPSISFVTVKTTSNMGFVRYGIVVNGNGAAPILEHLTVNTAIGAGVYGIAVLTNATATIRASTIDASGNSGEGVSIDSTSTAVISRTIATGPDFGVRVGGTVRIDGSRLKGGTGANKAPLGVYSATARVATTMLDSATPILTNGGVTVTCVFTYNSSYLALNATCQ